ncbi:hypothetical protein SJAG_03589 [Schizosaccharomyces japonicus yFS275]|uniref:CBS and PB1 domain-containing protein n=1 Tax=Schizosaccharomyces japonicus (strain yFS275 / FY16936) TaxID=402676 RepID=B6K4M7_SCHJY|nr:hypothetical protein SJAG_03589 [Schizosaccharomyces japonicus yFS275]EEB08434.1 hypothetical protein SJAG_03589 [Schizosaccharomyces japonicus yFS275]
MNYPISHSGSVLSASVMNEPSDAQSTLSETRKRQNRKDEALRKKIATELNKKMSHLDPPKRNVRSHSDPTTVASASLAPALTVQTHTLVSEACQLMAAKREECLLVVDEAQQLTGIITSLDVSRKCVGGGFDPRGSTVESFMTEGPICITSDTQFADALALMLEHDRIYLPVVSDGTDEGCEDGDVLGILDICSCLHEPLSRVKRQEDAAAKLMEALAGAHDELDGSSLSGSAHASEFVEYVESLRQKAAGREVGALLEDVLFEPVLVGVRTSVLEASQLMAQAEANAVLVMDQGLVSGIFTSHDIVLRVVAAGLDPSKCSVIRIMTPHPDCALVSLHISTALERMLEGGFNNLPVIDENDGIVGLLNITQLAQAIVADQEPNGDKDHDENALTPENLKAVEAENAMYDNDPQLAATPRLMNAQELVVGENGSQNPTALSAIQLNEPAVSVVMSLPAESSLPANSSFHGDSLQDLIQPTDSASQVKYMPSWQHMPMTVKYRSTSGRVHRMRLDDLGNYRGLCAAAAQREGLDSAQLVLTYLDDEGDHVELTSDDDFREAIILSKRHGFTRVEIRGSLAAAATVVSNLSDRKAVSEVNAVPSSVGAPSVVESTHPLHAPVEKKLETQAVRWQIPALATAATVLAVTVGIWYARRKK